MFALQPLRQPRLLANALRCFGSDYPPGMVCVGSVILVARITTTRNSVEATSAISLTTGHHRFSTV
jgi:hypothetical protein